MTYYDVLGFGFAAKQRVFFALALVLTLQKVLCVSGADNSGKEDVKKYTDTLLFYLDNAIKLLNNLPLRGK